MHELSIAISIVATAADEARRRHLTEIQSVHVNLGALSGVVKESLLSAFARAREGSVLENARLVIQEMPIVVYCPSCRRPAATDPVELLCCARCGTLSGEVIGGARIGARWIGSGAMTAETRMVQVRTKILKDNDIAARALRERFRTAGTTAISLVSSPGAGKTALLEKTLSTLAPRYRVAALVGDLATDNDAVRMARAGVPVRQITTGTVCHLEAAMVAGALEGWQLDEIDFLFIENVGNLVCPATYDLGEELRLVLFSVTEGEDKPRKYPTIFNTADQVIITKVDLAEAVDFDRAAAASSIQSVRPGMRLLEVSAKTGQGLDAWIDLLETQRNDSPPLGIERRG